MEDQENRATENEQVTQPAEPEVDTSRDTDELKSMIAAMNTQLDALKAELQKNEPAKLPEADFGAYFAEYMFGKKNK